MAAPGINKILKPLDERTDVNRKVDGYLKYFNEDQDAKTAAELEDKRKGNTVDMINRYYDLVTDFYEYGWGDSFHFFVQKKGEVRDTAIKRHQYRLALKLGIRPRESVLDIGCGVGGPARNIAEFSQCDITGINCNEYQLQRARHLTEKRGLSSNCTFVKADFCDTGFESCSFDKAYAIEATCHAADKTKVYGEAFRLLKPGGVFAFYEWLMTDKYNSNDEGHRKIKHGIMEGDSLPVLEQAKDCINAMKQVGFEVLEAEDLVPKCEIPWWSTMAPRWSITDFKSTPLGRWMTHISLFSLETIGLVPRGSSKVHKTLLKAADSLVKGGKEEIFTPMFLVVGQKPLEK